MQDGGYGGARLGFGQMAYDVSLAPVVNSMGSAAARKIVSRKPRGRRAGLAGIVNRLEREHVALLLAICDLEAPQHGNSQGQALRDALLPLLRADLRQTQRALARAAHGAYGVCEDCHKQLALRELEAQPTQTHCANCQTRLRHNLRRR